MTLSQILPKPSDIQIDARKRPWAIAAVQGGYWIGGLTFSWVPGVVFGTLRMAVPVGSVSQSVVGLILTEIIRRKILKGDRDLRAGYLSTICISTVVLTLCLTAASAPFRFQRLQAIAQGLKTSLWQLQGTIILIETCSAALRAAAWMAGYVALNAMRQAETESRRRIIIERDLAQARQLAVQSELAALEARVNPHFLFNALNTGRALIGQHDESARDAVNALSLVLRCQLGDSSESSCHSVTTELDVVGAYLAIERLRFPDRLSSQIAVASTLNTAALSVPKFMVLEMIENAVKHGVSRRQAPTSVCVSIDVRGESLVATTEHLGQISEHPRPGRLGGMDRCRSRLRLLFGDQASLTLTQQGDRVISTLVWPIAADAGV